MADSKDTAVQVALLNERVESLISKVEKLDEDLAMIKQMADRWRGGFLVMVAVGSVIGWVISLWDKVAKQWH